MANVTITLYSKCRLNTKYDEVYLGTYYLDTYLSGLQKLQIYSGEDVYFTNNGSISFESTGATLLGHQDVYNYMTFVQNGEVRYAFVNNITLVDGLCVINYTEDIWSNYGVLLTKLNFKMKNSLLAQADTLTTSTEYDATDIANFPKKLPIEYQGHNAPTFKIDNDEYKLISNCYVLVIASMYTLEQSGQKVNKRYTSNYLLQWEPTESIPIGHTADIGIQNKYLWPIDNTTVDIIGQLKVASSDTQITNNIRGEAGWYYEIVDIKLIPANIGGSIFERYTVAETVTEPKTDYGMHNDFTVEAVKKYIATDGQYYWFKTNINFMNLMRNDWNIYTTGTPSETRYQYNGLFPNERLRTTKTIKADFKVQQIGNMSRTIPFEPDGLDHEITYYFCANAFTNSLEVAIDNTIIDISDDFVLPIPVDVQTADVTQQQRTARNLANVKGQLSIFGTYFNLAMGNQMNTINGAMSMMSASANDNYMGAISKGGTTMMSNFANAINAITSASGTRAQLEALNAKQYTTNKIMNSDDVCLYNVLLGGLREIQLNPSNEALVNKMISTYGYLYSVLINDTSIFDTTSTNYVRFNVANVYGGFSQDIERQIEQILENGVILLHS